MTGSSQKLTLKTLRASSNEVVVGSNRADKTIRNLSKFKKLKNNKSKNLMHVLIFGEIGEFTCLTSNAKKAFNRLWQTFIKVLIFWQINPKCHIWIETDASRYTINTVVGQLTSD